MALLHLKSDLFDNPSNEEIETKEIIKNEEISIKKELEGELEETAMNEFTNESVKLLEIIKNEELVPKLYHEEISIKKELKTELEETATNEFKSESVKLLVENVSKSCKQEDSLASSTSATDSVNNVIESSRSRWKRKKAAYERTFMRYNRVRPSITIRTRVDYNKNGAPLIDIRDNEEDEDMDSGGAT